MLSFRINALSLATIFVFHGQFTELCIRNGSAPLLYGTDEKPEFQDHQGLAALDLTLVL